MKAAISLGLVLLVLVSGCSAFPGDGGDTSGGTDHIGADEEHLVNVDNREDFQLNSNVGVTPDGSVVVAWASKSVDGDGYGVVARFYDENLRALTGEVQVNVHAENHQKDPDVAVLSNGNVVVTWESWYQERDDGYEVYARLFDEAGTPLTGEIRLNNDTVDYQRDAAVAAMPGGGFVAAWLSWDTGVAGYRTYARQFDAAGEAMGSPVRLSDSLVSNQRVPDVERAAREVDIEYVSEAEMMGIDTDGDGNVVLTWTGLDERTDLRHVWHQRFDDELQPLSEGRRVADSDDPQLEPYVDVTVNGAFIVAWHNVAPTDDDIEAFARPFNSEGEPTTETVQLNSYTKNWQNYPVVAMLPDGRFVAAWESNFQDGNRTGIFFRRFDAEGKPVAPEKQVNSESASWQEEIDVGVDRNGTAVVTFMSYKGDPYIDDIFARSFPSEPPEE